MSSTKSKESILLVIILNYKLLENRNIPIGLKSDDSHSSWDNISLSVREWERNTLEDLKSFQSGLASQ